MLKISRLNWKLAVALLKTTLTEQAILLSRSSPRWIRSPVARRSPFICRVISERSLTRRHLRIMPKTMNTESKTTTCRQWQNKWLADQTASLAFWQPASLTRASTKISWNLLKRNEILSILTTCACTLNFAAMVEIAKILIMQSGTSKIMQSVNLKRQGHQKCLKRI